MNLKLFALSIICMIFLVGSVSAFEFDNGLKYENDDLKVTIENGYFFGVGEWFGFNEDLGSAELKSHKSVNEVLEFGYGSEEVVMYYDFDFLELYENGLGEVYFTDERTGKEIEKDYSFVYWTNETYEINVYESQCSTSGNETKICESVIIGKENSTRKVWKDYNSRDIIKGKIRIGLKTYVDKLDVIDGVWTIGGKKVEKHAVWTASLNVGLNHYYNLDNLNDSLFTQNLTNNASVTFDAGLIGDNANGGVTNGGNFLSSTSSWDIDGGAMAISVWVNSTSAPTSTNDGIVTTGNVVSHVSYQVTYSSAGGGEIKFTRLKNGVASDTISHSVTLPINGSYQHIVASYDGAVMFLYLNGALVASGTSSGNGTAGGNTISYIFTDIQSPTRHFNGKIDEVGIWGRNVTGAEVVQLNNSGEGITYTDSFLPTLTLDSPTDFFNTTNTTINFEATINNVANLPNDLVNATLEVFHSNGSFLLSNTLNITGSANVSNFTEIISIGDNYLWNVLAADNNSLSGRSLSNGTFSVKLVIFNSATFNSSTFETSTETFIGNVTTNGTAPTSASLIYAGTQFTGATVTNTVGNDYNISRTIGVPLGSAINNFSFNFSVGSDEVSTINNSQTVNAINFTLCSTAPLNVPYINLTFKNETTNEESLNATIISTWIYSLSDVGDVNKTLSFSNSTENGLYSFCFIPANRSLNIDLDMTYNNAQSQQRSFSLISVLTNITAIQVLYLLPTTLGLFSPFQVVDNLGEPISTVNGIITRILNSVTVTVDSSFTDDSGFVSYFLNPEVTYIGSFSKAGFTTETFSFTPTLDTRTVILGGGTGVIANGTSILTNTTYTITPTNRTLTNSTDYLFTFNVSSSQEITFISMNITSNGTSHLFVSNAGQGSISGIVNTGENSSFIGYFVMSTAEETFSLASIWIIDQTFIGDYSLFRQMVLFNEYEFTDFIRLLITLCLIIAIMIFINNTGISDDAESKIAIALLLVWAFSIVGWLDTGIISSSGSANIQALAQFSNQFGIAILSTGAGTYFILRRVFT